MYTKFIEMALLNATVFHIKGAVSQLWLLMLSKNNIFCESLNYNSLLL